MIDFEYHQDDAALDVVLNNFSSFPKTSNMIRLALSLGAVIAGGAAISLFEFRKKCHSSSPPAPSKGLWKDIDLWFPNQASLDTYFSSVSLNGIVCHKSFGGNAIDLRIPDGGPPLQVITFRIGSPVEIISQFDFKNCAIAFDGRGFWLHKDVPELLRQKKLELLNDNSKWFISRVSKYLRKGYCVLDKEIQERMFRELSDLSDKAIELAESFISTSPEHSSKSDESSKYRTAMKAICKADSIIAGFLPGAYDDKLDSVLLDEQKNVLLRKHLKISEVSKKCREKKKYSIPYGYGSSSGSLEPEVDALIGF